MKKDKSKQIHVAVVMRKGELTSRRTFGDYSCFLGETEREAIDKAINARSRWHRDPANNQGPYVILSGQLTGEVEELLRFKIVGLLRK